MVRFATRTQHDHRMPVHGVVAIIEVADVDVGMDAADVDVGMECLGIPTSTDCSISLCLYADVDVGMDVAGVHVDVRLSAASTGNALIRNLKVQSPTAASTV